MTVSQPNGSPGARRKQIETRISAHGWTLDAFRRDGSEFLNGVLLGLLSRAYLPPLAMPLSLPFELSKAIRWLVVKLLAGHT
jgi:hypothetical protein